MKATGRKYTYLVWDKRYYKIGESVNPDKRINELKTANPGIELIAYGNNFSEKELHESFYHKRIGREWFNLSQRDVILIRKLLSGIQLNDDEYKTFENIQFYAERIKNMHNFRLSFGKNKGKKLADFTTNEDRDYLTWILLKTEGRDQTKKYIRMYLNEVWGNTKGKKKIQKKKDKTRKLISKDEWFKRYEKRQRQRMYNNLP